MVAPLSGVTKSEHVEGALELHRKLEALGGAVAEGLMRQAVRAGIMPAFELATRTIPVGLDTHRTHKGRLVAPGFSKRSLRIVTRVSPDKKSVSAALGVRKEAFYAVLFTELGTSKMPARPWLRPAMRSTQGAQQYQLAKKLRDRIEHIAKQGK